MPLLEIILLACLLVVIVILLVRLDNLQRQVQSLRTQMELHIQRGHGPTASPNAPVAPPAPMAPPAPRVTFGSPLGNAGRPLLRLVKD
jgi:hypothetical protein